MLDATPWQKTINSATSHFGRLFMRCWRGRVARARALSQPLNKDIQRDVVEL